MLIPGLEPAMSPWKDSMFASGKISVLFRTSIWTRFKSVRHMPTSVLHYAIKSLDKSSFYYIIKFFGITNTVIYFTIYESNFLIDFDRRNIKLTSSGTPPAQIDNDTK